MEPNIADTIFKTHGITSKKIKYQLNSNELQNITLDKGMGKETSLGALAIETGKFTGRSPQDRYIVKDTITSDKVWWGEINIPFDSNSFQNLYDKVISYLNDKEEIYVRDCCACSDEEYKLKIRMLNEYPWSNLFALNMFLRPTKDQPFTISDWTVINAPGFKADCKVDGTRQENFSIIDFSKKIILIGGTGYTGEIKKGVFSVLNFTLPVYNAILPMHCAANYGENEETAIFFGLSGTGKTTLSADPDRRLIGDDEHGWTPKNTIFNFEGGCYAKVINLSKENEPDIYNAIKPGALLENVILNEKGIVDFKDGSITQNTRVSYPIDYIKNIITPSVGSNPKNLFFLTADAFGVIPPISKLTPDQAAYHFISGYTSKVAGTEAGVKEPQPSFSACFGAPFMPLHPAEYAKILISKIEKQNVNVWLVNTGWVAGGYNEGKGKRIPLQYTRAIINAALNGSLGDYDYKKYHIHSVFGVAQPRECIGVPKDILSARASWNDDDAYYKSAFKLANSFRENFKKFEAYATESIKRGGPLQ